MLIIFDLDDTLIDTSGTVIPYKLKALLLKLSEAGVSFPAEKALNMLRNMNHYGKSLLDAFSEFLEINSIDKKYFLSVSKEVFDNLNDLYEVSTVPNALEVISELTRKHTLAIVSYGKKEFQYEKMKKAGIDTSVFSRIVISNNKDKKPYYQALLKELDFSPLDVLVCGDRIQRDLSPAKELGFKTVHVKWGRGLAEAKRSRDVDFTIAQLDELRTIITQFEST